MVVRALFGILFLAIALFASSPKIVEIKTTSNEVTLYFNEPIKADDFKFSHYISQEGVRKNIYDMQAELAQKSDALKFEGGIEAKVAQFNSTTSRIVFYSKNKFYTSSRNIDSNTVAIGLKAKGISSTATQPKSQETYSEFRDKVVVIDPGHGGKDCGALSIIKKCEKHIVLDIAQYVKSDLEKRGYKKVYLTRDDDTFIKLRNRTGFANQKNADIFVSIHANSLDGKSSEKFMGFETYFLSNARSDRAKRVAALENKKDIEDLDYFSKDTLLSILNTKRIIQSNKLALDIQNSTLKSLGAKYSKIVDGGVREGPFWVLVGAQMPSILIEVGYISNRQESERLINSHYQKLLAKGVADGVDSYFLKN